MVIKKWNREKCLWECVCTCTVCIKRREIIKGTLGARHVSKSDLTVLNRDNSVQSLLHFQTAYNSQRETGVDRKTDIIFFRPSKLNQGHFHANF